MDTLNKDKTVFFTGHRVVSKDVAGELLASLYSTVASLVIRGYDTFICGGAVGFDTMAAECVLQMKDRFPHLTLILALPCRDQTLKWSNTEALQKYKAILGKADKVEYIADFYTDDCMHKRNRYMADNSRICIAFWNGKRGGTSYTVKYAQKIGCEIINIYPEDDGVQCALEIEE